MAEVRRADAAGPPGERPQGAGRRRGKEDAAPEEEEEIAMGDLCVSIVQRQANPHGNTTYHHGGHLGVGELAEIGVVGSGKECGRALTDVVVQFPLPPAIADVTAARLELTLADPGDGGGVAVVLHGLGPRAVTPAGYLHYETDFYAPGVDPPPPGQVLLAEELAAAGLGAGARVSLESPALRDYVRDQAKVAGHTALRFSPSEWLGCEARCDFGCQMKRHTFDPATLLLTVAVGDEAPILYKAIGATGKPRLDITVKEEEEAAYDGADVEGQEAEDIDGEAVVDGGDEQTVGDLCVSSIRRIANNSSVSYSPHPECQAGGTISQVGVVGNDAKCHREQVDVIIHFPLPRVSAADVEEVRLELTVFDSRGGGVPVALHGLGPRNATRGTSPPYPLAARDFYEPGTAPARRPPGHVLLAEEFLAAGGRPLAGEVSATELPVAAEEFAAEELAPAGLTGLTFAAAPGELAPDTGLTDDATVSLRSPALRDYVRDQLDLPGSTGYTALRLSPSEWLGCEARCDSSCQLKRYEFVTSTLSLTIAVRDGRTLLYKASDSPRLDAVILKEELDTWKIWFATSVLVLLCMQLASGAYRISRRHWSREITMQNVNNAFDCTDTIHGEQEKQQEKPETALV